MSISIEFFDVRFRARRVPARNLHLVRAFGRHGALCRCSKGICNVLHHDHLMNYALDQLAKALAQDQDASTSTVWQREAHRFLKLVWFQPRWLCSKCNAGDGDGKKWNWVERGPPIYPYSFSMTADELWAVRAAGESRGPQARRDEAIVIWNSRSADHVGRQNAIRQIVADVVGAERLASAVC